MFMSYKGGIVTPQEVAEAYAKPFFGVFGRPVYSNAITIKPAVIKTVQTRKAGVTWFKSTSDCWYDASGNYSIYRLSSGEWVFAVRRDCTYERLDGEFRGSYYEPVDGMLYIHRREAFDAAKRFF